MQIYVRHYKKKITKDEIANLFGRFGTVEHVNIITENNIPEAYVKMSKLSEADYVISQFKKENHNFQINRARSGHIDRRKHCRLGGRRKSDFVE